MSLELLINELKEELARPTPKVNEYHDKVKVILDKCNESELKHLLNMLSGTEVYEQVKRVAMSRLIREAFVSHYGEEATDHYLRAVKDKLLGFTEKPQRSSGDVALHFTRNCTDGDIMTLMKELINGTDYFDPYLYGLVHHVATRRVIREAFVVHHRGDEEAAEAAYQAAKAEFQAKQALTKTLYK